MGMRAKWRFVAFMLSGSGAFVLVYEGDNEWQPIPFPRREGMAVPCNYATNLHVMAWSGQAPCAPIVAEDGRRLGSMQGVTLQI